MAGEIRLGVDIGGTFTDIVLLARDGTVVTKKVSSSTDDYARAIVEGLQEVFAETGLTSTDIAEVLHGTTVASNAILERKGAKTALITTQGFRDILEIRTLRMPRLYDLAWEKPPMLIERRLRFEVDERLTVRGDVERKLRDDEVERIADRLLAEGIEAVAVCLIHAYANPVHERRIGEILRRRMPQLLVSLSADVLPEIKEYERSSTTTINAYVMPVVQRYLAALGENLTRIGVASPLLLMQSNGGLTPAAEAARFPVNIIESGPAAGVIGGQVLARRMGESHVITFDMGGTTAKASLIENDTVTRAAEYQVGGGIMIGSRLLTGAGYTLRVPAIDLAEVGAGGGSIVWLDRAGALQVGPHSAGAVPGPVCYDTGGTEPTVTDCNVILGYINPAHLVGGALKLNAARARAVVAERVAKPLKLSVEDAAHGTHLIAASNMIRAIRAVSTERGRDPRDYSLFAFGGQRRDLRRRHGRHARHPARHRAAVARPVLGVRAALRRRRASFHPHLSAAGARDRSGGARRPGCRARRPGARAADRRGVRRLAYRADAQRAAALSRPEFRIDRAAAGRPARCRAPGRARRGVRARA